jgi:hypothetical protein
MELHFNMAAQKMPFPPALRQLYSWERPVLAHEAFREQPADRHVVLTGPNVVGARCCASEATATKNSGVLMSLPG